MRNLFLLLLLGNMALFTWQHYWPVKTISHIPELPASTKPITMLRDVPVVMPLIEQGVKKPQSSQCFTLGPFTEKTKASEIRAGLEARAEQIEWRSKQETRHHRYWVFVPPLKNRAQAIAMSKDLARKKVKDYYIVSGGEKNNGISLGHFKEKQHADRRLERLKKLGFSPVIKPIYRQYELFWLDYKVATANSLDDVALANLLPAGVARLKRNCAQ